MVCDRLWAAQYNTWLLITLTPKRPSLCFAFSFLFSVIGCLACAAVCQLLQRQAMPIVEDKTTQWPLGVSLPYSAMSIYKLSNLFSSLGLATAKRQSRS